MPSQPTIVLADDHTVVRHGLRLLLERDGEMEVLAEAADADGALRYVRGHKPDVLVLDLNMPGRDSLDIIPEVDEASPGTRVVVLTMQHDPSFARAALKAGAAGYVLKDAADAILVQAIESARDGQTYVDPTVGARLQRLAGELRLLLHREHDDVRARRCLEDPRDRGQARLSRHVEVEHEHIGLVAEDVAQRAVDVAGLGDDLHAGLREQQAQARTDHGVVVGEDNGEGLFGHPDPR